MSRAIGIGSSHFSGIRTAGNPTTGAPHLTYIPPHTKGGKKISAKLSFNGFLNSHRGTNQRTGEQGRSDVFPFVAWGKLATTCAKTLSIGKAIDATCTPQSYRGRLFNPDGTQRVDAAGVGIEIDKISFTITNIVFGEETPKTIEREIQDARRPQQWNNPNHPDWQTWLEILKQRMALVWDGQSQTFGYARVVIPQGPGIALDFSGDVANAGAAPTYTATVTGMEQQVMEASNNAPIYQQMPDGTMKQVMPGGGGGYVPPNPKIVDPAAQASPTTRLF